MIKNRARFSRTVKKKNKNLFKVVSIFILFTIFVGLIGYLLRLPSIQVSQINISGASSIASDDIKNALLELTSGNKILVVPRSNTFLLSEKDLENRLMEEFQAIESIKINTKGRNTLLVEIIERVPRALWCRREDKGDCFFIDNSGLIFEPIKTQDDLVDKIYFYTDIEGDVLGKYIASKQEISNFWSAIEFLAENAVSVQSIELVSKDKVNIQTDIGRIVLNPLEEDILDILENVLLLVLKEREKKENAVFEYLDARFGNKIFYKLSM
jgi:cell division septal protein FtsQ